MESLSEEQIAFIASHYKRLRHCYVIVSEHDDNAEGAIMELQRQAFAGDSEGTVAKPDDGDEATPMRHPSHQQQSSSPSVSAAANVSKKLYRKFCKECVSVFNPPALSEDNSHLISPATAQQYLYLFPATLFTMYLEKASDSEIRMLKLMRKIKRREEINLANGASNHPNTSAVSEQQNNDKHLQLLNDAQEAIANLQNQCQSLTSDNASLSSLLASKERDIAKLQQQIKTHEKNHDDERREDSRLAVALNTTITNLKNRVFELEGSAANLSEKEILLSKENKQLEQRIQRLSDELAASHRRYQHLQQQQQKRAPSIVAESGPTAAAAPPAPAASVVAPLIDDDEDDLLIPSRPPSTLLQTADVVNLNKNSNTNKRKAFKEEKREIIPIGKRKKGSCEKCGHISGERFQCQRCKLKYHESCGGPFAPDENDLSPEMMDRIVDSENDAVIQFLTESTNKNNRGGGNDDLIDDVFGTAISQYDFTQIDDMRQRRLCQLYCRTCRREQGIIIDGDSTSDEDENENGDDESSSSSSDDDGWSTDSSDVREREMNEALDISRFPATQKNFEDFEAEEEELRRNALDVVSLSSTSSSETRLRNEKKALRKQKLKDRKRKEKKLLRGEELSDDDETNFIVNDGASSDDDDANQPYKKSRFVISEAKDADDNSSASDRSTSDSDDDGGEEGGGLVPEEGFEQHRRETANRMIKQNHKRKRSGGGTTTTMNAPSEKNPKTGKKRPVLDEEDLNVLEVLGLEAPKNTTIVTAAANNGTSTASAVAMMSRRPNTITARRPVSDSDDDDTNDDGDDDNASPSGMTRDQAVEISQSTLASPSSQQQQSNASSHRGGRSTRSHAIFNTLRHVNINALSGGNASGTGGGGGGRSFVTPRPITAATSAQNSTANADDHWGTSPAAGATVTTNAAAPSSNTNSNGGSEANNTSRLLFSGSRNQKSTANKSGGKRTF